MPVVLPLKLGLPTLPEAVLLSFLLPAAALVLLGSLFLGLLLWVAPISPSVMLPCENENNFGNVTELFGTNIEK